MCLEAQGLRALVGCAQVSRVCVPSLKDNWRSVQVGALRRRPRFTPAISLSFAQTMFMRRASAVASLTARRRVSISVIQCSAGTDESGAMP
jgi:hypothetical protein